MGYCPVGYCPVGQCPNTGTDCWYRFHSIVSILVADFIYTPVQLLVDAEPRPPGSSEVTSRAGQIDGTEATLMVIVDAGDVHISTASLNI